MIACESCGQKVPAGTITTIDVIPNDKRHLGASEAEGVDLCAPCYSGEGPEGEPECCVGCGAEDPRGDVFPEGIACIECTDRERKALAV